MSKGLQRSLRGSESPIRNIAIPVNVAIAVTDGAPGYGSAVISDLPEGNILVLGAVGNLSFATADADVIATFDGDFSVGSTATADGTLDGTDANVIPSTALGAATAKVSPVVRGASSSAVLLDNTDGSLELNLNLIIDDTSISGDASFTASGVLHLAIMKLGDD